MAAGGVATLSSVSIAGIVRVKTYKLCTAHAFIVSSC